MLTRDGQLAIPSTPSFLRRTHRVGSAKRDDATSIKLPMRLFRFRVRGPLRESDLY